MGGELVKRVALIAAITIGAILLPGYCAAATQLEKARARMGNLRFASYATSHQVEQLATDEEVRTRARQTIQRFGITKLYTEVYRGGHAVSRENLIFARDWLREEGIKVVGGIATVPGGDFGVRQEGPLGWFNWQNEKTQRDLERIIRTSADIFETFIIDDFLCTGDVSAESKAAKGNRSWGEYRRALLSELAGSVFIRPAKEVNPDITMIIKYPQWYDRFHLFGYDTQTLPRLFDQVWVGTETRGRNTRRYGFVQPYEGFVNYRWLADISGGKIGGAWFDHGDCGEHDFLDQAYTSVLAGAAELVFFSFTNLIEGHPDHERVVAEFERLADLAAFVRKHPVIGVPAYKPPNSEPDGDMYIMDFIGMLGVPLIPVRTFPQSAPVIFLPAQAAADPNLLDHVNQARKRGAQLILTTSLLIACPNGGELARMVGLDPNIRSKPVRAQLARQTDGGLAWANGTDVTIDLESPIESQPGCGNILCTSGDKQLALLATSETPSGRVALLNTHTYSQTDFDAVGEVLLCPRPLGLLDIQGPALSSLRAAFGNGAAPLEESGIPTFDGPACVTFHPFGSQSCVIQNFNDKTVNVTVTVRIQSDKPGRFADGFSGQPMAIRAAGPRSHVVLDLSIPARGRVWVQHAD